MAPNRLVLEQHDDTSVVASRLKARARHLEDEQRRERVLPWEYILPQWIRPAFGREKT